MQVKVCPKCGTLNDVERDKCGDECGYVFTGTEEGAKGKATTLAVQYTMQSDEDIRRHLSTADATRPSGGALEVVKPLLLNLGIGLGIAVAGLFLVAFSSSAASPYHPASTTIINLLGPWVGGALVVLGLFFSAYRIVQVLRGPRLQDPAKTIETYFSSGVLDWPRNFWFAWRALTPQARVEFGSLRDFKNYWRKFADELSTYLPAALTIPCTHDYWKVENTFELKDVHVTEEGRTARARFTIGITQKREYDRQTSSVLSDPKYIIRYGTLNLSVVKQLVQADGGQWLLAGLNMDSRLLNTACLDGAQELP